MFDSPIPCAASVNYVICWFIQFDLSLICEWHVFSVGFLVCHSGLAVCRRRLLVNTWTPATPGSSTDREQKKKTNTSKMTQFSLEIDKSNAVFWLVSTNIFSLSLLICIIVVFCPGHFRRPRHIIRSFSFNGMPFVWTTQGLSSAAMATDYYHFNWSGSVLVFSWVSGNNKK